MSQENSLGDANARHHQLYELLQSAPPSESECELYLPRFDAYIAAQLSGEDYLTRYSDVAIHLDSCVTCADTYSRLYELEVALATEALPLAAHVPAPDLAFLSAPKTNPARSLVDLLADTLFASAKSIRLQLTEELLALLHPQQPLPLTRSSIDDSRYYEVLYELQAEQLPESTISIRLTAYRDALHPEEALLEVIAMPPGVNWPNLGGYTVTLQMGQNSTPGMNTKTTTTDAWGVAVFVEIPIARLHEVTLLVDLTQ